MYNIMHPTEDANASYRRCQRIRKKLPVATSVGGDLWKGDWNIGLSTGIAEIRKIWTEAFADVL
jgi:hypothetical protein